MYHCFLNPMYCQMQHLTVVLTSYLEEEPFLSVHDAEVNDEGTGVLFIIKNWIIGLMQFKTFYWLSHYGI